MPSSRRKYILRLEDIFMGKKKIEEPMINEEPKKTKRTKKEKEVKNA
jgi:hypothetical protein